MRYIIDRFEGRFAVCEAEDKSMTNILISSLPEGCIEGSVIETGPDGYILIDNSHERNRIREKMKKLFN